MIFPNKPIFTGDYSMFERFTISRALWNACKLVHDQLAHVAGIETVFEGLKIEFVSESNQELNDAGALGLAYHDRNINLMPSHFDLRTFQLYSGIFAMELTHSAVWRLTENFKICNDGIHWLFNNDYVDSKEWLSALTIMKFGGPAKFLLPNMSYLWQNMDEIMGGIRSGKYSDSGHIHKYFSDPAYSGPLPYYVAATKEDLHHIEEHLG